MIRFTTSAISKLLLSLVLVWFGSSCESWPREIWLNNTEQETLHCFLPTHSHFQICKCKPVKQIKFIYWTLGYANDDGKLITSNTYIQNSQWRQPTTGCVRYRPRKLLKRHQAKKLLKVHRIWRCIFVTRYRIF